MVLQKKFLILWRITTLKSNYCTRLNIPASTEHCVRVFHGLYTLFFIRNRIPWLKFDVLNFSVLWASNYFNVFSSFWKIVSKPIVLYAAVNWLSYALFIHFLAKNVYSNRSKCFLIAFIVSEITFSVFLGCCEMLDCYFQTEFVLRLFLNMRAFWGSVFLWHCSYKKSLYNH